MVYEEYIPEPPVRIDHALLKRLRKRAGTQTAVASRAGIARSYLSELENGVKAPRMGTVEKLERALADPMSWLGVDTILSGGPATEES